MITCEPFTSVMVALPRSAKDRAADGRWLPRGQGEGLAVRPRQVHDSGWCACSGRRTGVPRASLAEPWSASDLAAGVGVVIAAQVGERAVCPVQASAVAVVVPKPRRGGPSIGGGRYRGRDRCER